MRELGISPKEVGVIDQLCLPSCGRYGNGKFRQKPLREWSALDSIHQNHLSREGLRWNDGKKLRSYDNMPTYPDDPSVLFVWEIASKLFTKEMVSINLLFDCSIIKHFTQFYADISRI